MMQLSWGTATDKGPTRRSNEDALLAQPPVFLVADGMGGYASGGTASAIVVEEFSVPSGLLVVTPEWVMDAFQRAHARIRRSFVGGTTVAGFAVVRQNGTLYWLVFNIGDSRVYYCARGECEQISVDHSVVQELIERGELTPDQARLHPQRHIITRAVGSPEGPRPDFWLLPAERGARLMICSDGVTGEVEARKVAGLVAAFAEPQQVADSLVSVALLEGGRDNVTAVVVDVLEVDVDSRSPDIEPAADLVGAGHDDHTLPRFPISLVVKGGQR